MQILVVVAIIHFRTLRTEVGKVSTTTVSDSGLIGPKLSKNLLYSRLRLSERVSG